MIPESHVVSNESQGWRRKVTPHVCIPVAGIVERGQGPQECQLAAALERGRHMRHLQEHTHLMFSQVGIYVLGHWLECSVSSALQACFAPFER